VRRDISQARFISRRSQQLVSRRTLRRHGDPSESLVTELQFPTCITVSGGNLSVEDYTGEFGHN
jgi:hypothetical protein